MSHMITYYITYSLILKLKTDPLINAKYNRIRMTKLLLMIY